MGTKTSSGFVLITGLLFLLVITILGVSAVSTVTLQERMASNLREKGRANEATNAAVRNGESWILNRLNYPSPYTDTMTPPSGPMPTVWGNGVPSALLSKGYEDDALWNDASVSPQQPTLPSGAGVESNPEFFLEEGVVRNLGGSLTPASQGGTRTQSYIYYYRVTARGVGGNNTAVSVHQSMYGKIY
jgi:type IV pilus assembly protein PilX